MKRNYNLDKFRGFTIISMVLFHLFYNINYYWEVSWYDGTMLNKIWQLSIAMSFFTISGITSNYLSSNKNIKRGIITSLIGFAITLVTRIATPDQYILWGVLNALGLSMILVGLLSKNHKAKYKWTGLFLLLFILSYNIPRGALYQYDFFKNLYDKNLFVLGFPSNEFISADYFPMLPWFFIYLFGYYLGAYLFKKDFFGKYGRDNLLGKIGRLSMPIYLIHQIILYPLVTLIYNFTN